MRQMTSFGRRLSILRRIPSLKSDVNMFAYGIRTVRNVHFDRYRTEGRYVQYNEDEFAERCGDAVDVSPETIETLQAFRKLNENCQRLLGLLAEGCNLWMSAACLQ